MCSQNLFHISILSQKDLYFKFSSYPFFIITYILFMCKKTFSILYHSDILVLIKILKLIAISKNDVLKLQMWFIFLFTIHFSYFWRFTSYFHFTLKTFILPIFIVRCFIRTMSYLHANFFFHYCTTEIFWFTLNFKMDCNFKNAILNYK